MQALELDPAPCADVVTAIRGAGMIVTATAAKRRVRLFGPENVAAGTHIHAMGGDCPGKTELDPELLRRARVVVEYLPQSRVEDEIQNAPDAPVHAELWEIVTGLKPGRDRRLHPRGIPRVHGIQVDADPEPPRVADDMAHTVASILALAGKRRDYEFQRLHGMGEALYEQLDQDIPCRIYAPVGAHEDLLPYLVRCLLENDANTSFVNLVDDAGTEVDEIVANPVATLAGYTEPRHPAIPRPVRIHGPGRDNSRGLNLDDRRILDALRSDIGAALSRTWTATPLVGGERVAGTSRAIRSPADHDVVVGEVTETEPEIARRTLSLAAGAAGDWDRTAGRRAGRRAGGGSRRAGGAPRGTGGPEHTRGQAHADMMDQRGRLLFRGDPGTGISGGSFFAPHIYGIDAGSIPGHEVFGPILHVVRYPARALDEVLDAVRATGYGLTLGIHSRIDETVRQVQRRLPVGNTYVNRNMIGAVVGLQPFGGEGLSGTGPKAGGPWTLARYALERTESVNAAAVGGDTGLLTLGD